MEKGDIVKLEGRQHWFRFHKRTDNGAYVFWGPVTEDGRQKSKGQFVNVTWEDVKHEG